MKVKSNLDRAAFAASMNDVLQTGLNKIELATLMVAQGMLANPESSHRTNRQLLAEEAAELAALLLNAAETVASKNRDSPPETLRDRLS